jgi:hypothetical protein
VPVLADAGRRQLAVGGMNGGKLHYQRGDGRTLCGREISESGL